MTTTTIAIEEHQAFVREVHEGLVGVIERLERLEEGVDKLKQERDEARAALAEAGGR